MSGAHVVCWPRSLWSGWRYSPGASPRARRRASQVARLPGHAEQAVYEYGRRRAHAIPLDVSWKILLRSRHLQARAGAYPLADGVEAFTITGKASRPPLPGLLPEHTRRYAGYFALPSIFINLLGDHVAIDWLEPLEPTRTRITSEWLFDPHAMARPNFDPMDAVAILDLVNRQDWDICALAQQGMTSRVYARGGNYAPLEHHIHGFVDYVLARLGDAEAR